jgi:hypothetical protein
VLGGPRDVDDVEAVVVDRLLADRAAQKPGDQAVEHPALELDRAPPVAVLGHGAVALQLVGELPAAAFDVEAVGPGRVVEDRPAVGGLGPVTGHLDEADAAGGQLGQEVLLDEVPGVLELLAGLASRRAGGPQGGPWQAGTGGLWTAASGCRT